MTQPRILPTLTKLIDCHRPAFFTAIEWRFYLLSMPALTPVGAYFIMGSSYFQHPVTFLVGTLVNLLVYWYTIVLFTVAVRWVVIRRLPSLQQAGVRPIVMLLLVGLLMAVSAVFDLYLFSIVPGTGVVFSWEALLPVWLFGSVAPPMEWGRSVPPRFCPAQAVNVASDVVDASPSKRNEVN